MFEQQCWRSSPALQQKLVICRDSSKALNMMIQHRIIEFICVVIPTINWTGDKIRSKLCMPDNHKTFYEYDEILFIDSSIPAADKSLSAPNTYLLLLFAAQKSRWYIVCLINSVPYRSFSSSLDYSVQTLNLNCPRKNNFRLHHITSLLLWKYSQYKNPRVPAYPFHKYVKKFCYYLYLNSCLIAPKLTYRCHLCHAN